MRRLCLCHLPLLLVLLPALAAGQQATSGQSSAGEAAAQTAAGGEAGKAEQARPADTSKPPRVLLIVGKDCPRCERELARLRRPGGDFEKLRSRGWKIGSGPENHLQIVDREALRTLSEEVAAQVADQPLPKVICVRDQEIVRSFTTGCTTPLDMWTFGWLIKGIDERPPGWVPEKARVESTGHYPLRGNHWSIDEDWNPSRERVIAHLAAPITGIRFPSVTRSRPGRTRSSARCTTICTSRKWGARTIRAGAGGLESVQRHAQTAGALRRFAQRYQVRCGHVGGRRSLGYNALLS